MRSSENIDPSQLPVSVWKQSHYNTKPLISFVPSQYTTRLEILVRTLPSITATARWRENQKTLDDRKMCTL